MESNSGEVILGGGLQSRPALSFSVFPSFSFTFMVNLVNSLFLVGRAHW